MSATASECSSVRPSSRVVEKVLILDTMPPILLKHVLASYGDRTGETSVAIPSSNQIFECLAERDQTSPMIRQ